MTDEPKDYAECGDEQEGKSLDELAGEGHVATPGAVHDWLEKYQYKSMKEMLESTPAGITANYDENSKILTISDSPSLPTEEEIMKPVGFKEGIFGMRSDIELVKSKVKNWMKHPETVPTIRNCDVATPMPDTNEMKANLMLAYRHLENARMRLGKAVQAYDGGKSCYPR